MWPESSVAATMDDCVLLLQFIENGHHSNRNMSLQQCGQLFDVATCICESKSVNDVVTALENLDDTLVAVVQCLALPRLFG